MGGRGRLTARHPYRRGDVVLVRFPFSDASGQKERPAIVLSTDIYHQNWHEVLVVAVTSQQPKTLRPTDYFLQDWAIAGLNRPSWVRSHLATVHFRLIIRKLGTLTPRDLKGVEKAVRLALGL